MAIMDLQGLEVRGSRENAGGGSDASLLLCQRTSSLSVTECH